jgi:hypothetical protein
VAKGKYIDLVDHPGIRVRVERLDGYPPIGLTHGPVIWWDRELITFLTEASPDVRKIIEAEQKIKAALKDLAIKRVVDMSAPNAHGEVVMFQGTFVKIEVWCPTGTAKLLGIKGYGL